MIRTYTYSEPDRRLVIKHDLAIFGKTVFWIAVSVAGLSLFCEDRLTFLCYSLLGLSLCALPDMIGYFRMINTSVHIINIDDNSLTVTYFKYLLRTKKIVIPVDQLSFSVRATLLRGTTTDVILYANHKRVVTIVPYNAGQEALNFGLIWDLLQLKNNNMERRLRCYPLSRTYARSVHLADTNLEWRLRKVSDEMTSVRKKM